jgi:UPF0755 protein
MPSPSRGKSAGKPRAGRTMRGVRGVLYLTVAIAIGIGAMWFTRVPRTADSAEPAHVLIPVHATFHQAADSLARAHLIRWPMFFSLYGSLRGHDRKIRAGTYRLARGQGWDALIDALRTGRGVIATITIPEGWGLFQIVPYLARELELPADSVQAAVRDSALRIRLGVPAETLEGYLFPDTYVIPLGTTARQAIAMMTARFLAVWRPEWDARLDTLKRSRHEIMTLASIVEKEVELPEERPVVAAVYWNRLRIHMMLQADPTVIYAMGKSSAARVYLSNLKIKSPYNTYSRVGLPPGPIASPGAASIEATLYPAKVPYLYFVGAADGHHEFRTSDAEHQAAVQHIRAQARADSAKRAKVHTDSLKRARADSGGRGRGGAAMDQSW